MDEYSGHEFIRLKEESDAIDCFGPCVILCLGSQESPRNRLTCYAADSKNPRKVILAGELYLFVFLQRLS